MHANGNFVFLLVTSKVYGIRKQSNWAFEIRNQRDLPMNLDSDGVIKALATDVPNEARRRVQLEKSAKPSEHAAYTCQAAKQIP